MKALNFNKRINIGDLNRKISFLTTTEGTNEAGDTILVPAVFQTALAAVSPIVGRDYFEAKKYQSELTYVITVRYFAGITPDMKIQFQDRILLIQDIFNVLEKNEFLEIVCIERVVKNG